jgi:hypothetical protein
MHDVPTTYGLKVFIRLMMPAPRAVEMFRSRPHESDSAIGADQTGGHHSNTDRRYLFFRGSTRDYLVEYAGVLSEGRRTLYWSDGGLCRGFKIMFAIEKNET